MAPSSRFTHCFPSNIEGIDEHEALRLVQVVRNGSESERQAARSRLIEGCIPLVLSLVASYVRSWAKYRYLTDDLVSVAMLEVTRTADRLAKNESTHPWATICNAVKFAIRNFPQTQAGFSGLSSANRFKQKKRGRAPLPKFVDVPKEDRPPEPWAAMFNSNEMLEELLACCRDDKDRDIVLYRYWGDDPKEIAAELGYGQHGNNNVTKRLRAILARYEARNAP